jgi:ubiquinone/menaquinone biosynthesis C-methylase UbiE
MVPSDRVRKHYKHLERVARIRGLAEEDLVHAFELERKFHFKIIEEKDPAVRARLYYELYEKLHLFRENADFCHTAVDTRWKARLVNLLRKELEGKSILDVGCGGGDFLLEVDNHLAHKKLVGIEISPVILPQERQNIEFIQGNVIDFSTDFRFDVVFSDNVIEHIALEDLPTHLQSIKNAMAPEGKLIIITPNHLFGPNDITIIIDSTYTNQIEALGGHLHETTYTELICTLKENGFSSFKTVIPTWPAWHYFSNVRISPRFMQAIENRKYLLNVLYRFNILSILLSRLLVVLICVSK